MVTDITERKRAEEALKESSTRTTNILESITDAFYTLDREWRFTYVNHQAELLLQRPKEQLLGESIWEEFPEAVETIFYHEYHKAMAQQVTIEFETYYPPLDMWVDIHGYPSEEGLSIYWQDITERKRMEEQLEHQAFHDLLTDLPNRALFVDRLEHALARSERGSGKIAVLFMDLDNFKTVNDSLGHETGDQLLRAVAQRLQACLRPEDTLARFGGDEFTILLESVTNPSDVARVATRVLEELQEHFVLDGREVFISASIGISLGTSGENLPEELLRQADTAMYRAKEQGGADYQAFDPSMYARVLRRLELENNLRRAVEREEFTVYYQPEIHLRSGKIIGVEALVRWKHPEGSLVSPGEFIPVAEDTGLIVPIGQWVMEEACRQVCSWHSEYPNLPPLMVGVNLSLKQFRQPGLVEKVAQTLQETGLDPFCLSLEITESIAMEDVEASVSTLQELKRLGVRLTMDDFGAGHSSLTYLIKRFRMDMLKIDRSFINEVVENPENGLILSGITNLAQALGLEVVAEGIETTEQLTRLREIGCDMGQGYYLARPLPAEEARKLLEKGSLP